MKRFLLIFIGFIISIGLYILLYYLAITEIQIGEEKHLIPMEYIDYFVWILPGNLLIDIILLYVIPIITMIIILLIAPKLLMLLFRIHKVST